MPHLLRLLRKLSPHRAFLIYLLIGTLARFWQLPARLYFIWDQGRDAWAIHRIWVERDLTLIGPTSGLSGFFLGPLWFYLGIPGYILGQGDPYWLSAWYVAIASLALPIFWYIAHRLFTRPIAPVVAYVLALLPGSIQAATFIWNPLVSVPLMALTLACLLHARRRASAVVLGFGLLGLTLQSEFAYAIFFIVPLWLLIPWLRGRLTAATTARGWLRQLVRGWRHEWRSMLGSALAVMTTLIPQLLFEYRHNFLMTQALWQSLRRPADQVTWLELWSQRPLALLMSTAELLWGGFPLRAGWTLLLLLSVVGFAWHLWRQPKINIPYLQPDRHAWLITLLLACLPYIFYLIWRGNHGFFFSYYLTPHFVFLVPTIAGGLLWLHHRWQPLVAPHHPIWRWSAVALFSIWLAASTTHFVQTVINVQNESGLQAMESALHTIQRWQVIDHIQQPVIRIFTPNAQTEHYDFLLHWRAKRRHQPVPLTVRTGTEPTWYLLLENDPYAFPEKRFLPWYATATAGGVLVRRVKTGALFLETWMTPEQASAAAALGIVQIKAFTPPPLGKMLWVE